jgi:hypothetical protein
LDSKNLESILFSTTTRRGRSFCCSHFCIQLGCNRKEVAASVTAIVIVVMVGYVQKEKDGALELCGHCSQTHQCDALLHGELH